MSPLQFSMLFRWRIGLNGQCGWGTRVGGSRSPPKRYPSSKAYSTTNSIASIHHCIKYCWKPLCWRDAYVGAQYRTLFVDPWSRNDVMPIAKFRFIGTCVSITKLDSHMYHILSLRTVSWVVPRFGWVNNHIMRHTPGSPTAFHSHTRTFCSNFSRASLRFIKYNQKPLQSPRSLAQLVGNKWYQLQRILKLNFSFFPTQSATPHRNSRLSYPYCKFCWIQIEICLQCPLFHYLWMYTNKSYDSDWRFIALLSLSEVFRTPVSKDTALFSSSARDDATGTHHFQHYLSFVREDCIFLFLVKYEISSAACHSHCLWSFGATFSVFCWKDMLSWSTLSFGRMWM